MAARQTGYTTRRGRSRKIELGIDAKRVAVAWWIPR